MQTLSVRIFILADMRTKGKTIIKDSLNRICETGKSSTAKIRRIKYVRDLFHVFLNNVKIILHFLIYKPGIRVLLDIML